jgi:hypothetical protein
VNFYQSCSSGIAYCRLMEINSHYWLSINNIIGALLTAAKSVIYDTRWFCAVAFKYCSCRLAFNMVLLLSCYYLIYSYNLTFAFFSNKTTHENQDALRSIESIVDRLPVKPMMAMAVPNAMDKQILQLLEEIEGDHDSRLGNSRL